MPLPETLARFNRLVTNRITRPFASRLPGFAVLHHTGRVTGRRYATPLNAWRQGSEVVVALTYGDEVDWLANARSEAPSSMVMEGVSIPVGRPRDLDADSGMDAMPVFVRPLLRALGVTGFVAFPIEDG